MLTRCWDDELRLAHGAARLGLREGDLAMSLLLYLLAVAVRVAAARGGVRVGVSTVPVVVRGGCAAVALVGVA